jgi:predicted  nucleic acid-binding Zn-ribbon protein
MQLHIARLCLDCEEIHDQQTCPICSSESFAYITRWIPAPERRTRPRPEESRETAETYRQLLNPEPRASNTRRWVKRGVLGLAAVGIAGWAWRRKPADSATSSSDPLRGETDSAI